MMFRKAKRKNLSVEDIQADIDAAAMQMQLRQIERIETVFQQVLKKINQGQYNIEREFLTVRVSKTIDRDEHDLLKAKFEDTRLEMVDWGYIDAMWGYHMLVKLRIRKGE